MSKSHRNAAAEVTTELDTYHEDPFSIKTVLRELHKSNIHGRASIDKHMMTENNAKRRKRWDGDDKTWTVEYCKYIIWANESPSRCFQQEDGSYLENVQGNLQS